MFGMCVSLRLWYPTLHIHWPEVMQFVFFLNAPFMYFLFYDKKIGWSCPWKRSNQLIVWVCLSNCYLIVAGLQGELISAFLSPPAAGLTVHKARDATHILFVLHEQTDCKLADNFCTDNVIYGCQPFVCSVCFIQIWTEWTSPPPLTSALKSHQFTSILSYLKFIGGNHLVECTAVAMETKGPVWTSEGLGTCKI